MARTAPCESFVMFYRVSFESVARGHHIYKVKWTPDKGENLVCRKDEREEAREHGKHAIGVYKKDDTKTNSEVGHVPNELSKLLLQFLESDSQNMFEVRVNGKRYREVGLVVSVTYFCYTNINKIAKVIFSELNKKSNLYEHFTLKISDNCSKYQYIKNLKKFVFNFSVNQIKAHGHLFNFVLKPSAFIREGAFIREWALDRSFAVCAILK